MAASDEPIAPPLAPRIEDASLAAAQASLDAMQALLTLDGNHDKLTQLGQSLQALVALATMAVRNGGNHDAEITRLNGLVADLRQSQLTAQQNSELLREIVNHLPIGLTVQDEQGRFVVVNAIAATNLAMTADELIGLSPAHFLSEDDAASRRDWELGMIHSGRPN